MKLLNIIDPDNIIPVIPGIYYAYLPVHLGICEIPRYNINANMLTFDTGYFSSQTAIDTFRIG